MNAKRFTHACLAVLLSLVPRMAPAQSQPAADSMNSSAATPPLDCSDRIIPYSDWRSDGGASWNLITYATSGGALYYFGAEHSDDPDHPQFDEIRTAYDDFEPTVVFYEGPERPVGATADETIRLYGESGFVRFLAERDGIEIARLEPDPGAEMQTVLQQFTIEEAMLFFVLREAARLRERKEMSAQEIKDEVAQLLERASSLMETPIKTLDDLDAAYRRHWTEPENWWMAPSAWFDPIPEGAETGGKFTHAVNRASSDFRNVHMYRVLTDAVLKGEHVFAAVGRNHVPMQAQAIRCALDAR